MTDRTAGRRRHDDAAEIDDSEHGHPGEGFMTRVAERMIENPAMSGGLIVMALTAVAVVSNALFLQQAQHPEPWFATRPAPLALAPGSDDVVVPDPRPRVEPPPARVQVAEAPPPAAPPVALPALVTDLQRALSERGFYRGKIDGIPGSRTKAAITAYEQSQGLEVTGQPSARILDHITTASIQPAAKPPATPEPTAKPDVTIADLAEAPAGPAPAPASAPAPAPAPVEVAALEAPAATVPQAAPDGPEGEMLSYPPRAEPPPEAAPVATNASVVTEPAPSSGAQRTLSVQKALNLIGYGPVREDGVADEATIGAIRRFELDNGLPITGAAGDTLINRLVAIGAMEAA